MLIDNLDSNLDPVIDLQDALQPTTELVEGKKSQQTQTHESSVLAKTKRRGSTAALRKFSAENALQERIHRPKFHSEDRRLMYRVGSNIELAEVLMEYGKNNEGIPALQNAIIERDYYAIGVLIKAGARVSDETKALVENMGDAKISE